MKNKKRKSKKSISTKRAEALDFLAHSTFWIAKDIKEKILKDEFTLGHGENAEEVFLDETLRKILFEIYERLDSARECSFRIAYGE